MQPCSQQAQNMWMMQHAKGAHLSRYAGWNYYSKIEPTICIHNNSKNFVYSQTVFHHVSVVDTAIVREVHPCEPKHRCCKLPVCLVLSCTQIHFASPSTQGASQQALCWWGCRVNLCVHNTDSLQQRCFGPQRWTSSWWLCLPLKHVGI